MSESNPSRPRDPQRLRPSGLKLLVLGIGVFGCLGVSSSPAATFEEQRATVSAAVESQPDAAIVSLLKAGIEENHPAQAVAVTQDWLRRNLPQDPAIFYYAGRSAELAGDWQDAVALYQQFLSAADPKSDEATDAITAVHALLAQHLDDSESAYAWSRGAAGRLAVNPRFRQWDRWFLDTARSRGDLEAVALRLLATVKAGVPEDQLIALYDDDLQWLLDGIQAVRYDELQKRFAADFVSSVQELAAALPFDEEFKLLLDWSVSVKAYNMAMIDGQPAEAPLAKAKALIGKFPRLAQRVQTDWAGGHNGRHYRDDPKKYWTHETEAKMAPVRAALDKLSPLEQADLLHTWSSGHYDGGPDIIEPGEVPAFVLDNSELVNRRTGPVLRFEWNKLTPEEARKLAPHLAQNPSPEASLVRVIAAAGDDKNLDKAMDALLGPEVWRLGPAELDGRYADQLWHWAGRPGDNAKRDQEIKRSKDVLARIPADEARKEAPANQRLGTFRMLWNDYRSNQPKQPAVRSRLANMLRVTPEAVGELLRDASPEADLLLRDAMAKGFENAEGPLSGDANERGLSPGRYNPIHLRLFNRHRQNLDYLKSQGLYEPHPLLPELEKAVAEQLKRGQLEPWVVMSWINAQFPEDNEESVKLMEALFQSPEWKKLPPHVRFGARSWFTRTAMTPQQFAHLQSADPDFVCRELITLTVPPGDGEPAPAGDDGKKKKNKKKAEESAYQPGLEKTVAALDKTIEGIRSAPFRVELKGLEQLAKVEETVGTDPEVVSRLVEAADSLRLFAVDHTVGTRLLTSLRENKDPALLLRSAAYLWREVQVHHRNHENLIAFAESLVDDQPEAASTLARCGLATIARHRSGHTWFNRETDIPRLKAVRGKAAMSLGLVEIPVPKGHPSYPVYQSQAEWMTGNEESAWDALDEHWDAFEPIHRELSVAYLLWVLQQTIYTRADDRQEMLVKSLLEWANEDGSPLTPTEKVSIELAYGDIAVQRGQLRQALEIYTRTQDNEAWQDLPIRYQATLRRARAQRLAKDFDGALNTLNELELERVASLWTDIRYARAEVYFDMEEYEDAKDDIDSILTREPNHPDAKILLGKVQLKREKLMEATEVELGSNTSQQTLVPGEKLKVTLNDPTLAVSGAGTEIEVRVWATSGDEERFFLRQFGDQKTKFRGEVPTELGAPATDDGTLQVIGDDEVFYAYTESFLEKMNQVDERRGGPITVASDALLIASARKLLTEAEQRTADMEAVMRELEAKGQRGDSEQAAKARLASRAMDADARAASGEITADEFGRFLVNVAKPGNPIHVRVIDPDRSRTPEIDELTVSVSTSSGDSISRVTLAETGTHTGWFEGSIPTTGAQARAFARDSEPGRNPNMVISPRTDYPAWRPVPADGHTPEFLIDLNDNLAIGEMTITAAEPDSALKAFVLQTGMNEGDMTTVAAYPRHQGAVEKPWHPSVVVMNDTDQHHANNNRSVYELEELKAQVERGWLTQTYPAGASGNVSGPSEAMTESIPGQVEWKRQDRHHNAHVVYRFRGYFHEPEAVTRRFKLELGKYQIPKDTHPSVAHPPQFLLAVDGRPITDPEKPDRLEGEVNLRAGIHHFEIWATGWDCTIGFGRSVRLMANLEDEDKLVDCPDSFFDPATFPENSLDHRNAPATITPGPDGTTFTVKFAEASRTRLLKLVLVEQESPVPSLNKITLKQPDGSVVLPVPDDFAELNKNDTLEMLTGDRISVRYVDDRFVTKDNENHERFLDVAFTDARVEFADIEPRWSEGHRKDMPYYERLLRFKYDEPLSLVVTDPDMDVSGEADRIPVTLTADGKEPRKFEAVETGDSTGIFKLLVTPVATAGNGEDEVVVTKGGTISVAYLDEENNRPGVPYERVATIEHAAFATPEFVLAHAEVGPWEPEDGGPAPMRTLIHGFEPLRPGLQLDEPRLTESIRPRLEITNTLLPASKAPDGGFAAVHGRPLHFEVVAPQLALRTGSEVTVYAQTAAGRKAAGAVPESGFDISVPGTVELTGRIARYASAGTWRTGVPELPIYTGGHIDHPQGDTHNDRFRLIVPLAAGLLPPTGVLSEQEREDLEERARDSRAAALELESRNSGLIVGPGDTIYLGFRYTDESGQQQWVTAATKVLTHGVFDLMAEDYRSPMESAYVGESLNLRVVDLGADVSDAMDTVNALVQAKSGAKASVELRESGPHTGIFKGEYLLSYAKEGNALPEDHDVRREGFPVTYGDTVAARYTDANGVDSDTLMVTISKGADGSIQPFSKKYENEEIGMRTQFSLAEAYLEMAKRHRQLGQAQLAQQEYDSAKLLLSKAMDEFRDPNTRAHAEYLLGTLTMEEAVATEDSETRETRFRAALSRFMTVTGSYPETIHASRAQYRIATVYEALGEPDIAAQEYVKLAYKYPDSEFLATSMLRLGSHFLKKAAELEARTKELLAKGEEDKDAQYEGTALKRLAEAEYLKTASIFSRLQERFPGNELAGPAGLRAGQAYMRAGKNPEAVEAFQRVVAEEGYDGPKVRAQAMYWSGMCYQELRQEMAAYSAFKRLTYDFPESEWAAYARAQLSTERLLNLETELELERLEAGQ